MALQLRVVTPTRTVVDAEVTELTAPGIVGEFGVLPQHVTFLGQIGLGVLRYVEAGGGAKQLTVQGGYAEVIDDVVTVLADEAEFADEIDTAAAKEEIAAVEKELAEQGQGLAPEQVDALLQRQRRAEIQLEVAGGAKH